MSSGSAVKRIGGDWVENLDPNTGRKYYANLVTKATQWTWPEEIPQPENESAAAEGESSSSDDDDLKNWQTRFDPSSKRKYYVNIVTKESRWTPPAGYTEAEGEEAGEWSEQFDPNTKRTYYVNLRTGQSSWTKPEGATTTNSSDGSGETSSSSSTTTQDDGDDESKGLKTAESVQSLKNVMSTAADIAESGVHAKDSRDKAMSSALASLAIDGTKEAKKKETGDAAKALLGATGSKAGKKKWKMLKKMVNTDNTGTDVAEDSKVARFRKLKELRKKAKERKAKSNAAAENDSSSGTGSNETGTNEDDGRLKKKSNASKFQSLVNIVEEAVEAKQFEEYAEEHFNLQRGMLRGKVPARKAIKWSPKPLDQALCKMESVLMQDAKQLNKNLISFMGDRSSSKPAKEHIKKMLVFTIRAPQELRDEVYCQVMKQTTENPSLESLRKGWQVILLMGGVYPPSKSLLPFLQSHIYDAKTKHDDSEVRLLAKFAMQRVTKTVKQGPRREVPLSAEIESARLRSPCIVRVYFLDGTYRALPVHSWTVASELKEYLGDLLGVEDVSPFSIFQVSSIGDEAIVDDSERIMELVAAWQTQHDEDRKKAKSPEVWHFVFKVRLFFNLAKSDKAATDLYYLQAVHDVINRRYPCSEQDCLTLAALQLQNEMGNFDGDQTVISGQLDKYLPTVFLKKERQASLEEMIIKIWSSIQGHGRRQARVSYIDYLQTANTTKNIYGSQFYVVEPRKNNRLPKKVRIHFISSLRP
eukprot:g776.t1